MKRIMLLATATATATAAAVIVLASAAAAHDGHDEGPHDNVYRISKTGEVKFGNDVRMGETLVRKGKYVVLHRLDEDTHLLELTMIGQKLQSEAVVYEIRTRLFPSKDPVKASAVIAEELRDRSYRVKSVQIVDEPGDHVPEPTIGTE